MLALYLVSGAGLPGPVAQTTPPGLQPQGDPDALYRQRADLAKARQAAEIWAVRVENAGDYESLWKLARAAYWLGTAGPEADQERWLERGLRAGERAAALEPNRPEGHFWLAATMGAYAEAGGMMRGLKYRGRIKDALERVLQIDPAWQQGSADRALGRWYDRVPGLFGGSDRKAEEHYRRALTFNPQSTATLVFLAELLIDEDRDAEARVLLQRAIDAPVDPAWAPEDERFKAMARTMMERVRSKK